jgi:hypothetical protein
MVGAFRALGSLRSISTEVVPIRTDLSPIRSHVALVLAHVFAVFVDILEVAPNVLFVLLERPCRDSSAPILTDIPHVPLHVFAISP